MTTTSTPNVTQLRESDQQLIKAALICLRDSKLSTLHRLKRQGCEDDDAAVREIKLDLEEAYAMYSSITGEEML